MLQYIKQNKQVIMVAVTLFVVSMSTILFFFGANSDVAKKDLKADVISEPGVTESLDVKSMQEKENTYRKVLNNQEDSVFVMNIDGTIKFSSWDVENSLGYKQDELNNQVFFLMVHPDDLSTFLGAFGKVIKNKKPVSNVGPYRLRDKSGEYHLHIGSFQPIMSQGNIDEIAVSSKDISKKVQNDQQNQDNGNDKKAANPKGKKIMNEKNDDHRFLADKSADNSN